MDLAALRQLHAPARRPYERHTPRCEGCDSEGFEAEFPDWPCRTAVLLWDETEREAVLADWRAWVDAQPKPEPSSFGPSFVPAAWQQGIMAQLNRTPFWKKFEDDADGSDGQ